jgi:hypothetical protein
MRTIRPPLATFSARARTMRCLCDSQRHAVPTPALRTLKVLKFNRFLNTVCRGGRAHAQVLHPGKEFRDGCRWRPSCPRRSRAPISISRAVGGSAHSRRRGCAEPSRVVRWSSPQPAEPIMATMWLDRYSAPATVHNNRLKPGRTAPPPGSCRSGTAGRRVMTGRSTSPRSPRPRSGTGASNSSSMAVVLGIADRGDCHGWACSDIASVML